MSSSASRLASSSSSLSCSGRGPHLPNLPITEDLRLAVENLSRLVTNGEESQSGEQRVNGG
jgi:hypothetical protein